MAEVTFGGLATGLPTDDIVDKLMAFERRPLDRLEKQKETETTRLMAFKQLNGRLDNLRSAVADMNLTSEVRTSSIELSTEGDFTASSTGSTSGDYDIAVVQLAQVQKTVSDGVGSNTDHIFGTGTFTIAGSEITIDDSNNSLIGLSEAINELSETTGVHATIINDGSDSDAYHLVLTGKDATTTFAVSSDFKDSGDVAIPFNLTDTRSAQQAKVIVDGIDVVSDSNTVSGVIPGVTLHLTDVSEITSAPGDPVEYATTLMTVKQDTDALKEKINTFVSSYNDVMNWITAGYAEFGASAPTKQEIEDGAEDILSDVVRGDSSVNGVKRQLQNLLSTAIDTSGSLKTLGQLGISTQRDGSIQLNESKLDSALEDNFDDVVNLLAGEDDVPGIMKEFNTALLQITGTGSGIYSDKKDRFDATIKNLDSSIERMEPLIAKKETTLRARFSAMELLVSGMNAQSSFLTQQMDMLNNMMIRK